MPREFVLLSPAMPGDSAFRAAAVSGDPASSSDPVSMTLDSDGLLARFHTRALDPLVTVLHPRRITPDLLEPELARLIPAHPSLPATPASGLWWSDVVVPWGPAEGPGVAVAERLAALLDGVLVDRAPDFDSPAAG